MESLHLGAVLVGARQVLMEQFRPEALLAAIEEHGCTHGFIVPTMTWAVIGLPARGEYDLTSMRCWMSASSPMPGVYPARMAAETTLGPGRVYNAYGTTESLVRPVPGAAVRIVDAGHGRLMAGQVGEVAVSSASLAAGYAGQPADWAAATFTADGALWYLTGDLGYTDGDGYLFLVDRTKDMLISGGENVYSAEVEAVLIQHPGLAEVAVVGCPDARWGERVVAVYAMVPGWDEPVDLAAFCDSRLAPFKRPRAELRVDALPRNAFGKVRKDRVRELARAQAEDAES
jgi:fatty-acyl-CoA synthase/long-chain acyl-CoA synthetase